MSDNTTNIRILSSERARDEGFAAGRRGLTNAANPYQGDTDEARAWVLGLLDGRSKRLWIVGSGRSCD